jgi:hypothetical protein
MCTISDLRRFNGEKGLFEEYAEQNGIKTYKMLNKNILIDNETGKTIKVKRAIPKYLKPL